MLALLHHFANPVWLLWALAIGFFACRRFQRPRAARMFAWAGVLWLFLISTSPLPLWLARGLEARHPVLDPAGLPRETSWQIMVLGGGHTNDPAVTPADRLSAEALGRLAEGIRLHRLLPGSKLVFSGFSTTGQPSQAENLAMAAVDLGVSPADTLVLTEPTRTSEEARAYVARFGADRPTILVTSAIHLPRAIGWFRQAGADPIPAPATHAVKFAPGRATYHFIPSPSKIGLMHQALHEYGGLLLLGTGMGKGG